jgi:hypothetical protein
MQKKNFWVTSDGKIVLIFLRATASMNESSLNSNVRILLGICYYTLYLGLGDHHRLYTMAEFCSASSFLDESSWVILLHVVATCLFNDVSVFGLFETFNELYQYCVCYLYIIHHFCSILQ